MERKTRVCGRGEGDDLGGLLVFFGPLHPGPAGELPAFAAKGSDDRPLTWGGLFEYPRADISGLLDVRDDLDNYYGLARSTSTRLCRRCAPTRSPFPSVRLTKVGTR